MKLITTIFFAVILSFGVAYAENGHAGDVGKEQKKEAPKVGCPATNYTDNSYCSTCHTMALVNGKPTFSLKEVPLNANYSGKPYAIDIVFDGQQIVAHMTIESMSSNVFKNVAIYLSAHPEIEKLILEIYSPGGSVMAAWRIIGIIEDLRSRGLEIETRCYGLAASAGGLLLVAGDIGKRYVAKNAEIMIHKVWQFSMFDISDPDSAEDKANILKHFQDNINSFFEERTHLTEEVINNLTYHKMYWFTGREAIENGVADYLIGKK